MNFANPELRGLQIVSTQHNDGERQILRHSVPGNVGQRGSLFF